MDNLRGRDPYTGQFKSLTETPTSKVRSVLVEVIKLVTKRK